MNEALPKAYKDGIKDFYGRDSIVTPDVLIPRPETEQIIDTVLNLAGKSYLNGVKPAPRILPKNPKVLDIGTGSGCIAITLKLEIPEADIIATDISKPAIKIAQKNALKHGINPNIFIISDLLKNVKFTPDIIVSNLPYVDEQWDWLDKPALSYEPKISLFAKDEGLALIKRLIKQSSEKQVKYLLLEADPCQHQKIIKFANQNSYQLSEIRGFCILLELH